MTYVKHQTPLNESEPIVVLARRKPEHRMTWILSAVRIFSSQVCCERGLPLIAVLQELLLVVEQLLA